MTEILAGFGVVFLAIAGVLVVALIYAILNQWWTNRKKRQWPTPIQWIALESVVMHDQGDEETRAWARDAYEQLWRRYERKVHRR